MLVLALLSLSVLAFWDVADYGSAFAVSPAFGGVVTAAASADNATRTPVLYALDQASGRTLWSQILPLGWQRANAAYDNGRIIVTGTNPVCCAAGGVTLAYAADSGTLLWRTELPGEYATTAAPTAANGVVYVSGSGAGALYAVSEDEGHILARQ